MFVNPISNFNVAPNSYQNNVQSSKRMPALQGGGGTAERLPYTVPSFRTAQNLNADTVSFGEGNKKGKASRLAQVAAAAALVAGGPAASTLMTSCKPDLEMNQSQHQEMWVNLKDYHKCGCDSFPIIINPGEHKTDTVWEKDTIIEQVPVIVPGDTVWKTDTIYKDVPVVLPPDTVTVTDTIIKEVPVVLPPDTVTVTDTIIKDVPIYIEVPVEKHDTIWVKPDTVYIPRDPHFEINDSINKDIDDFDIPTEGDGDFVYAFQGRNEYLRAQHLMVFDGFFSNEHKSSFIDHAFSEDDVPAGGDKPSKYYYTRYDISSDYENGRRLVTMYVPRYNQHQLPDDKKNGEAGWKYAGEFYVKNATVGQTAQLIATGMDGTEQVKVTKNEKRGPGNLYKEWNLEDNQSAKTTIQNVKAYRKDLGKLED